MNDSLTGRASWISRKRLPFLIPISFWLVWAGSAVAASDTPANIDNGLQQLVVQEQQSRSAGAGVNAPTPKLEGVAKHAIRDAQNRVAVNIRLNGKTPLSEVRAQLTAAGANVTAENSTYRNGVLSAFIPVNKIAELARVPGVLSISLGRRPIRNVGNATSGGVFVLHTDVLNSQGLDGAGITVGVLSDSYDKATTDLDGNPLAIHAAQDVASDDLPGTGNPNGNTDPVQVLDELDPLVDGDGFDEGRAMLQIIHDIAPKSKLAFATGFHSEVSFSDNIRKLRTDANCDVICDDIEYSSEPFFSDGMIAQAVDDVVTSSVLAGKKCTYFSSAGNQQGGGYTSTFNPVPDATARAGLAGQNVKLSQVPGALTTGGFHNFNTGGPPDISQTVFIPAGDTWDITFQWNDPFDLPSGVTTDYNILIFDAAGNYLSAVSGTGDNFATQEPIEDIEVENTGADDANFQIVISRAGTTPATPVAQKLRYLASDETGSGVGGSEYYQPAAPATGGHNCAKGAIGTAAYGYDVDPSNPVGPPFTPFAEDFTSQGPSTIDFDASGNRLPTSEIRQKPDLAAPDGGNTTFFGFDYEGDGLPNFFGTSAAAPHGAGVAALLLQKAGGPNSLTPATIKSVLQTSVPDEHDNDPFFSVATASSRSRRHSTGGSVVTVTGFGNSSNASSRDPNFFTVTFSPGQRGETLRQVTINLSDAGLKFDTTAALGFPFTLGKIQGISLLSIKAHVQTENDNIESITLNFAKKAFTGSSSVSFGIDRDFIGDGGGNSADLLEGARISASTSKNGMTGTFTNSFGTGYVILDGFGLIDAVAAAQLVGP